MSHTHTQKKVFMALFVVQKSLSNVSIYPGRTLACIEKHGCIQYDPIPTFGGKNIAT